MQLRSTDILNAGIDFGDGVRKVGRMAQRRYEVFFDFDEEFLGAGLDISPLRLPLQAGVQTTRYRPFQGLFGVFGDSLPDGWGRLLLDRALAARGVAHQDLSPLDRLAYVGRTGMGAMVYWPEIEGPQTGGDMLDLALLSAEMTRILEGESSEMLDNLYMMGGSSGGARPKVVVGYDPLGKRVMHGIHDLPDGYEHWLVKFGASTDSKDMAMVEQAYALMARAAGIEMTETALLQGSGGRHFFGTRRFDREGRRRLHMHTAAGLLHADHRFPSLDYDHLMQLCLRLNRDFREAEKLYRLAAFNVLARNRDDHGKNFSWLMDASGHWRFAPAYDLTFSSGPMGEQSTTVMGEGKQPGREHLLQLGEKYSLKNRKAIIEEVLSAVQMWHRFADEAGVTATSRSTVAKALGVG